MALVKELLMVHAALFALISHGEAIMGGREVEPPHSRPYMASIQVAQGETMRHECGGFLVGPQWVMTAAHCQPAGGMKVLLGAHSLSEPEETKQTFDIIQAHSHPQYDPTNFDNDIALIKLDRPVTVTEAVREVKYLRAGGGANPDTGDAVETAGWGSVNNLEGRADRLKEVTIKLLDRRLCARDDYYGAQFAANMMCAGDGRRRPMEDSCDGDSGGPLLYNGMVVGLTSNGGVKCGQARKPGVYTVISKYTDWIDTTLAL